MSVYLCACICAHTCAPARASMSSCALTQAERARPPGWTASGGDDTAGGFGVGHGDGLGGEAAAAEAARKEEAKLKLEEARRQRKAGKALENAHPEQLAVLLDARERSAKAGTGLNAHQQARV
eukprot:2952220-Prymnesium_polylepis.1